MTKLSSLYHGKMEVLSINGLRVDGRKLNEHRQIKCSLGTLQNTDGSAYYEQGNTKILVTIYGPREITSNKAKTAEPHCTLNVEIMQAPFSTIERKLFKTKDKKAMEYALAIKQTFENVIMTNLYPKAQIDIYIQILSSDGGELSCCINATTLALINAGINMKDYITSCSVGVIKSNLYKDLNYLEENLQYPKLILALQPTSQKLNLVQMESKLQLDIYEKMMNLGMESCLEIYEILKNQIEEYTWNLLHQKSIYQE